MIAVCKIRTEPHYRRAAFESGLRRLGYTLHTAMWPTSSEDFLIIWNRKSVDEWQASEWEKRGGTVLVCENGYLGRDAEGRQLYAISAHGHNGSGWFPVGDEDRFAALNIEVKPWRVQVEGGYVLICAQRGIGSKTMASPPNWHFEAQKQLARRTGRPLRIRMHPGNHPPVTPLEADLAGAYACAIWSSASGVRALTLGVPVFYDAPHWIAEQAARRLADVNEPLRDDAARDAALHRMSHGQWTVAEIETGEPFARLRAHLGSAPSWE